MPSWVVAKWCLLEKNTKIYLNVKPLDGRNNVLSAINFLKHEDPQSAPLKKLGWMRRVDSTIPLKAVINFLPKWRLHDIFYNLLHVADKENLLQTPEGRAVRVLVFYHNSRSYFFCGFKGAWTDFNGCRQLLDQTHRPFVSRTQAKPRLLRSKAFSYLLVSLEKKGSPAKSLLQAGEAFICFCWDEGV